MPISPISIKTNKLNSTFDQLYVDAPKKISPQIHKTIGITALVTFFLLLVASLIYFLWFKPNHTSIKKKSLNKDVSTSISSLDSNI